MLYIPSIFLYEVSCQSDGNKIITLPPLVHETSKIIIIYHDL